MPSCCYRSTVTDDSPVRSSPWRDVVAVYERVLDRQIDITLVAPGEPVPGVRDAILPLLANLERYDSPIDMTASAATFGIEPTPLEAVLRETLQAR
jgi:hypothetical protein